MAITDNRTANRDYLLPDQDNDLQDDVLRLISALSAIDADINDLFTSVAGRALLSHSHSFEDIPGLQDALDGKSAVGHTHALGGLSDVDVTGAAAGQFLKRVLSGWVPASIAISDVQALQTALNARLVITGPNGAANLPAGTTAQRPTEAMLGQARFNTSTGFFEIWNGSAWNSVDISAALLKSENLSDLPDKLAALNNLGLANRQVPAGSIVSVIGTAAPAGFIKANGSLLSRTTYADLWDFAQACGAIVSDASWSAANFGCFSTGDESTTFRIPDLRGTFDRGWDDGRGLDSGRAIGTYQDSDNKSHSHGINDPGHAHSVYDPGHNHGVNDPGHQHTYARSGYGGYNINSAPPYGTVNITQSEYTDWSGGAGTGIWLNADGTGIGIYGAGTGISTQASGAAEARPRNVALLKCIKY